MYSLNLLVTYLMAIFFTKKLEIFTTPDENNNFMSDEIQPMQNQIKH